MFKNLIIIGILILGSRALAQSDTQVFLFDVFQNNDSIAVENGRNISRNPGYNNQPSFYDDNRILYARNTHGQTDIALYDIKTGNTSLITKNSGGEFSPKRLPETDSIAAVRLDTNGLQRLYSYYPGDSIATPRIPLSPLKIGYFDFYDTDTILAAVLTPTAMDLHLITLQPKRDTLLLKNIGRSIHRVPGRAAMSYTLINEEQDLDLYLLDMASLESYFVCTLPIGIRDYVWLDSNRILLGSRDKLFVYDTLMSDMWKQAADLKDFGITSITRLAISPRGDKIALVGVQTVK